MSDIAWPDICCNTDWSEMRRNMIVAAIVVSGIHLDLSCAERERDDRSLSDAQDDEPDGRMLPDSSPLRVRVRLRTIVVR